MGHGGKRIGAGRKLGVLNTRTREVAERAMVEGKSPLEVMLENMRHFQQVALDAEAVIEGLTAEEICGEQLKPEDQFRLLLAKVKNAAALRQMAHECARDAAPFLHPRLANVQHSGDENNPVQVVNRIERVIVGLPDADRPSVDAEAAPTEH